MVLEGEHYDNRSHSQCCWGDFGCWLGCFDCPWSIAAGECSTLGGSVAEEEDYSMLAAAKEGGSMFVVAEEGGSMLAVEEEGGSRLVAEGGSRLAAEEEGGSMSAAAKPV